MSKEHSISLTNLQAVCFLLLAISVPGCDDRPTAVARFQVATAAVDIGDKAIDDDVHASLQTIEDYDFKSAEVVEQVARDLALARPFPQTADGSFTADGAAAWDRMIQMLTASITVTSETAADGLRTASISMRTDDPRLAPRFVNRLVENYLAQARTLADQAILKHKKTATLEVDRLRKRVSVLEVARLKAKLEGKSEDDADRELVAAREELKKWQERLMKAQMALTLAVAERGMRSKFIERAPDYIGPRN